MQELLIDAAGKKLGRLASEAAKHLRGKNSPAFTPNKLPETKVKITNASKVIITGNKLEQDFRARYSGYPGGLKRPTLNKIVARKGLGNLIREAIEGMIPRNKLRPKIMKHLIITE
ncbi:MAG: 50S ribosomal protein L13 [Patescibacteria group bacterium]